MVGLLLTTVLAVDPFELQVYDGTANARGQLGLELHANWVAEGLKTSEPPELPPHRQLHLTLEPSLGVTDFFELGAYVQTALTADGRYHFAGAKLRAKLLMPVESERWRLGVNVELAWVPLEFESSPLGLEVRPIVAWESPRWLFAVNPIVSVALSTGGPTFEPAAMALLKLERLVSVGLEYYGDWGPLFRFAPLALQEHYLFEVVNLLAVEALELNLGVGEGLTPASNPLRLKLIVGWTW